LRDGFATGVRSCLSALQHQIRRYEKRARKTSADPILTAMQSELAAPPLAREKRSGPLFLSYTSIDQSIVVLVGAYGAASLTPPWSAASGRRHARRSPRSTTSRSEPAAG